MNDINEIDEIGDVRVMPNFDYRWMDYTYASCSKHEKDNCLLTFTGHTVLQTLIRCYFSPKETTDQRFVYSGSADGSVYIYDILSGENASTISSGTTQCIRDVSWHPNTPVIASTSFNGSVSLFNLESSKRYTRRNDRRKHKEEPNYGYGGRYSFSYESSEEGDDDDTEYQMQGD